jgi:SPP1 family predicted phage head-tail adaptor
MAGTLIGRLNQRVRLETPTLTPDGQGGHTATWGLLAVVWARVEPLTYRETLQATQVTAVLSTGVTIWYRSDIAANQRIRLRDRVLQIESYQDPTGLRDELRLLCSEVQA